MDRIFKIALLCETGEVIPSDARVNNLMPPYISDKLVSARKACVQISGAQWRRGCYLAVAIEGECGREGAYAAAEIDGVPVGFPDRAASYPVNAWECISRRTDGYYTYYLPVPEEYIGKKINVYVFTVEGAKNDCPADVYLAYGNIPEN